MASVPLKERPDCVVRIIAALTKLPTGELGFADVCVHESSDPPKTAELFAYDAQGNQTRSLGSTSEPPKVVTWTNDMSSATYTAEGSLCATLYTHDGRDGPLAIEATVQGHRIPLGEDLAMAEDHCTQQGNADFPAYAPDGRTVALVASFAEGLQGQERIDLPWALILVADDGSSNTVLDGLRYPGGLAWLTSEILVFTGEVAGEDGLWAVRRDGSKLARLSHTVPAQISVTPDGLAIAGIVSNLNVQNPEHTPNDIVWYDMREFLSL